MANSNIRGRRHPACKICNSGFADQVDNMLASGIIQLEIARWLNEKKPGKNFTTKNISTHNCKHRLPSMRELNFETNLNDPSAPQKENSKNSHKNLSNGVNPEPDTVKPPSEETKNLAQKLASEKLCLSIDQFLDLLINRATEDIVSGKVKPTVSEAVKAAEIKSKTKQDSDHEKKLLNLFVGMANDHGYIRKN